MARAAGLVGTVVITHHVSPATMGAIAAASILAFTANWLSAWGFNQYVIVRGHREEGGIFHVAVLHLSLGTVALLTVIALDDHFVDLLYAPHLALYLPGMALSVWIRRLASVPEKLLMRAMRFRVVAIASVVGELLYVTLAVGLVLTTDLGGYAIVIANVFQAAAISSILIGNEGVRSWLTPVKLRWQKIREILVFGFPLAVETVLSEAGRYWDKLVFARQFGTHQMGIYSLAYNLADLPATYVGEHVASVLFPTLTQVHGKERYELFCRSFGLLFLIVLPMAVGLAAVAPTLVSALLAREWQEVSSYLIVLALVAIFRPANSVIASLLMASERNQLLMSFEAMKVALLLGGMWFFSRYGDIPAILAVGLALAAQSVGLLSVLTLGGFPGGRLLGVIRGPVLASATMAAGVLAVRAVFERLPGAPMTLQLVVEITTGAVVYLIAAWVFARSASSQIIEVLRDQLRGRTGKTA